MLRICVVVALVAVLAIVLDVGSALVLIPTAFLVHHRFQDTNRGPGQATAKRRRRLLRKAQSSTVRPWSTARLRPVIHCQVSDRPHISKSADDGLVKHEAASREIRVERLCLCAESRRPPLHLQCCGRRCGASRRAFPSLPQFLANLRQVALKPVARELSLGNRASHVGGSAPVMTCGHPEATARAQVAQQGVGISEPNVSSLLFSSQHSLRFSLNDKVRSFNRLSLSVRKALTIPEYKGA